MASAMIFALATLPAQSAYAQTLTVLHNFTGGRDGANPHAGLTMDAHGNLYGTAKNGGAGFGTVYKLGHAGSGWTLNPLYVFGGGSDGANPVARVIFGPNGTLYGTTEQGGVPGDCEGGCGTVFNLQPQPTACTAAFCPWIETVIYRFLINGGASPESEVTFDAAGNLYGTTYSGGVFGDGGGNGCEPECGLVYELTPSGNGWTESVPYAFSGAYGQNGDDGANPVGGVTFDSSGNLFGTTSTYGNCDFGIIFELTPSGSGWNENRLQQLCESGTDPTASMIYDSSSNTFYGASQGETELGPQPTSVFTLTQSGGSWVYTAIYTFPHNGGGPAGQLLLDSAGNLYGTTNEGGTHGNGTIFKLTPSNGSWAYTDLYNFTGGSDGSIPYSNLVMDAEGNLYGTASAGGANGYGVIFKFTP
jgi:uncharacterized repeat protein (TIGR03803 family)